MQAMDGVVTENATQRALRALRVVCDSKATEREKHLEARVKALTELLDIAIGQAAQWNFTVKMRAQYDSLMLAPGVRLCDWTLVADPTDGTRVVPADPAAVTRLPACALCTFPVVLEGAPGTTHFFHAVRGFWDSDGPDGGGGSGGGLMPFCDACYRGNDLFFEDRFNGSDGDVFMAGDTEHVRISLPSDDAA